MSFDYYNRIIESCVRSLPEELIPKRFLEHADVEGRVGRSEVLHGNADGVGCFALYTSL